MTLRPLLLGLALLTACTHHPVDKSQLHVVSFSPDGKTTQSSPPLRIRFSAPVVSDAEVGKPLTALPLTVTPAVQLSAYFADRETLVAQPKEPLKRGTKYEVELTGPLVGKQHERFSFVSFPLEFVGLRNVDQGYTPPLPKLRVAFNQTIAGANAAKKCVLRADTTRVSLAATIEPGEDADGTSVELVPTHALDPEHNYELVCEGLTVPNGNAPLDATALAKLHTYGPLREIGHAPDGQDVAASDVKISITFSTPVELDELRKHINVSPPCPALTRGSFDADETTYEAVADLDEDTEYTVSIDELKDRFGQALQAQVKFTFHTGDALPKISMETGIFAVETAAEGYPVWSRNVKKIDVECASVDKKGIVPLLTSSMDYDPWYDAGDSGNKVGWKKLGLHPHTVHITTHAQKNKWALTQLELGKQCGAGGLYLAEVRSNEVSQQNHATRRVLANVTNLGLLLKAGSASGLVWVVGISDGKPVAGAAVDVFDLGGAAVFHGVSDASGIVRLPGTTTLLSHGKKHGEDDPGEGDEDGEWSRKRRLIVTAQKNGDFAVVDGNWQNGIQVWNFGVAADTGDGTTRVRGFIQSDRGIYRPGETVHFKGLVRAIELGKAPRAPNGKVEVTVEDARDSEVYRSTIALSKFGGFWFDLPISSEARVGDWHVTASIAGQTFRESFFVQEFRKAEMEIRTPGLVTDARAAKKLRWKLEADYLSGAPVTGADVDWTVESRRHVVSFPKFPEYFFGDYSTGDLGWWSRFETNLDFVSDGKATTDNHGAFHIGVELEKAPEDATDYVAEVRVKDENDQVTTKHVTVTMHPSDFYLGMQAEEMVQAVGMPFAVNLVALTPDGKQVATDATLRWTARRTHCTDSMQMFRSFGDCKTTNEDVFTRKVKLEAGGAITERVMPQQPGEFEIAVETTDTHGHRVHTASTIYVIGKGEAFWSGDESDRLSLVASKQRYEAGETAHIVARANLPGATALVTLERNGILDAYVTSFSGSGEGFAIPMKAEHAPNVFASITLVKGRTGPGDKLRPRFKMGVVDLDVSSEPQRLKVAVSTERSEYRPGQPVTGTLRVTDASGKPVAAEVSLSVADEGVLQVIAYVTPDPMKTFYAPWGLGVESATTLNRISRLANPNEGDPDEGGDASPSTPGRIRSKFLSSAFWAPALVTNANGEATFTFTLPDNLTAFRLMAVAADKSTRFGSGDTRITVKKPLLLQPIVPRFLTAGDDAQIGVVVHNYTGVAGKVTVSAKAEGMTLATNGGVVDLPINGSVPVRFYGSAQQTSSAKLTFSASMGSEHDAVELTLPISRGLIFEKTAVKRGEVSGHIEVPVGWSKDDVLSASALRITVDDNGMSELSGSLRSLIEYPYGCLEQTLSRFIPLVKAEELSESLDLPELRGERARSFIATGAAKVVRHQHADGLFSLWPDSQTDPQLSAYALWGLAEAKKSGVTIDVAAFDRGMAALRAWTESNDARTGIANLGTLAMTASVFAEMGKPDPALDARLFEARSSLPHYGLAFLLSALKAAKAPAAQIATVESELLPLVVQRDGAFILPEQADVHDDLEWSMSSDVRSTAIALRALVMADPKNAINGRLAEGLVKAQGGHGEWHTTQENLYGLVALAAFAKSRTASAHDVTVTLGGQTLLVKKGKSAISSVALPLDKLKPGTLAIDGAGFVAVTLVRARRDDGKTAVEKGFALTRVYLDAKSNEPVTSVKPGQLIRVRVTASSSSEHRYVALVDPLPAGLEPLSGEQSLEERDRDGRDRAWERDYWIYREMRDDRVVGFTDWTSTGDLNFEYLARAAVSGHFTAPPASVEEMYHPEVRGRTTSAKLEVSK